MANESILQLAQESLWLVLILAAPPVFVAALAGMLIAFFQAATQIQEQTFQFAAKLVAVVITLYITSSLLSGALYRFTDRIFVNFPDAVFGA